MPSGTVKFFNAAKGFGFITPDEGDKEIFVPAASITASALPNLKAGQRVSFEAEQEAKGLKAVKLTLLAEPPRPVKPAPAPVPAQSSAPNAPRFTFYYDPASEQADDVLEGLRKAGHEPRVVDYIATPPDRNELKRLSTLLRGSNPGLFRRYDRLFHELRLDDRFLSETEVLDAIVEHPSLINGPVVATRTHAAICKSPDALKSFLGAEASDEAHTPKRKAISPNLLRLMSGVMAPAPIEEPVEARPARKAEELTAPAPKAKSLKAKARPEVEKNAKSAPAAKKTVARKTAKKPKPN